MAEPQDVLAYWLDEVGPGRWYAQDDEIDAEIARRFGADIEHAAQGGLSLWLTYPTGALAYVILMDQFPRNIYRNDARAYGCDRIARAATKIAIARGWDMTIDEPARQFFYLPLMHSENACDQDRCVRLMLTRLPETGSENLLHAKAHREVIRRFGRFPHRNDALGRKSYPAETRYLAEGGYGATVREMKAAA